MDLKQGIPSFILLTNARIGSFASSCLRLETVTHCRRGHTDIQQVSLIGFLLSDNPRLCIVGTVHNSLVWCWIGLLGFSSVLLLWENAAIIHCEWVVYYFLLRPSVNSASWCTRAGGSYWFQREEGEKRESDPKVSALHLQECIWSHLHRNQTLTIL